MSTNDQAQGNQTGRLLQPSVSSSELLTPILDFNEADDDGLPRTGVYIIKNFKTSLVIALRDPNDGTDLTAAPTHACCPRLVYYMVLD